MSTVTSPIILDSTGQAIADAIASLSSPQASGYNSNPEALGSSASPGDSTYWARGNHVHPKPSAADIGACPTVQQGSISLSATWTGSASP